MTILVTGATGQLGSKVVEALLTRVAAEQIAVSVRNPAKASDFAARGVAVRQGDFDDPASLDQAFAGVKRLLIISTMGADSAVRIAQHQTAVAAAQRAGVEFIAYTSATSADNSPLVLAPVHHATEQAIRATGIPFAFLRNNWYIENEQAAIGAVLNGAPLVTAAGQGKSGWALRAEYAEGAAAVLANPNTTSTIYELGGPLATYDDLGAALSQVLGRPVPVLHVDPTAYAQTLASSGLPDFIVPLFVALQDGIRQGALEVTSTDLATLLGRPVTPLVEQVAQLVQGN